MRKIHLIIILCIMTVITLAGCTGSSGDTDAFSDKPESAKENAKENVKEEKKEKKEKKKKKKKKEDKAEDEKKAVVESVDYEAVYEPVFDEILEIIDYGYNIDREYKYASGGLTERINYPGDLDLQKDIGYILEDISGDSVPELLVGYDKDIYCIFTIKDDAPYPVVECATRSSYSYMGAGKFFYCGSGGASITLIGENRLSRDGTEVEWDDFYFTDEKENGEVGVYHNKEGLFDTDGSEELQMSESDFSKLMESYEDRCEKPDWKPIGECAFGTDSIDELEPYCGVLYWYKNLQDSGKSWEEMEEYNSKTALVGHGWPYSTNNDEIRYVYQDLTGDGYDELIITYYNDPVDIYTNEGDAVYAYGVPYRAMASFFPDGTIYEGLTMGTAGIKETWYRYDEKTFKYVPVKESIKPKTSSIVFGEGKKISDVVVPESLR